MIGRTITLNGVGYQVVGVLAERVALPRDVLPTLGVAEDGQVLLPLPLASNAASVRTREDYNIMGTLKSGVAIETAQAEMDTLTARLHRNFPDVYPPNGGLTCCRARSRASVRWPCARRSAPDARASSASC